VEEGRAEGHAMARAEGKGRDRDMERFLLDDGTTRGVKCWCIGSRDSGQWVAGWGHERHLYAGD